MTKTILLTGATGFVGRHVLRELLTKPVKVRLLLRDGKQTQISRTAKIEKIITTPDLFAMTEACWEEACTNIDTVIHIAWYTEPGLYLQSSKNLDCLSSTLTLAKACVKTNIRRFVGIGTCYEYDLQSGYLSVDTPLKPNSIYASTKASTFMVLSQYLAAANIEFVWCRLFYLYGEGEDKRRFVPYLRSQLARGEVAEISSGTQIRDYLDVNEAGNMIVDVSQGSQMGAVNICSGQPITIRSLAEQIAGEYGRPDLLRFGVRKENFIDPPCVVGIR